jgi:hypothetical protein
VPHLDIRGRIARLDNLIGGLGRESIVIRQGNDPLLYLERQAYLAALDVAVRGLESARVVLAKARQRMAR